jgi:hypothetical protein
MFFAPGPVPDGTEGVGSRFHILRLHTCFRWYRVRRDPFSCYALSNTSWALPMAAGPVFKFCALGLDFNGTEGVGFNFHVLRSRTHFRRNRGRWVQFSCFALPDSFSTVPRASCTVFMFYAPGLILGGTESARFRFHFLRSRTRFERYRAR